MCADTLQFQSGMREEDSLYTVSVVIYDMETYNRFMTVWVGVSDTLGIITTVGICMWYHG